MGDGLKRAFAAAALSRIHDGDVKAAAIWARSRLGDTVLRKTLSIKQLAELLAEYRRVSLAAELTEPASQAAEHTEKELEMCVATPRGGE